MGELIAMFLTGGGSTAMGAILKGVFGMVFENRKQKHDLEMARESRGNENFFDFRNKLQTRDRLKRLQRRENYWQLLVSVQCVLVLSCAPSSRLKNWLPSPTQTVKEEQNFSSDSSPGQQVKNRSQFLLATSPLWETSRSFRVFWDSTSDHPPADND